MNLEQTVTALSTQNEQFKQENDQLKAVLGIVQENRDLRATVQGFIGADDSQGSVSVSATRWQQRGVQVVFLLFFFFTNEYTANKYEFW